MDINIRKANDMDLPAMFGLIKELAEFEKGLDKVTNSLEQMQEEKDLFQCYVAEQEGEVIGMALYYFVYYTWVGKSMYLEDLIVKEEHRGQNIGTMLMAKIMEVASKENCKRFRLQVLNWNEPAISFYEKHGFTIDRGWYNCDIHKF